MIEKLGDRGMGVVYKADDTGFHRQTAIKVLHGETVRYAERL